MVLSVLRAAVQFRGKKQSSSDSAQNPHRRIKSFLVVRIYSMSINFAGRLQSHLHLTDPQNDHRMLLISMVSLTVAKSNAKTFYMYKLTLLEKTRIPEGNAAKKLGNKLMILKSNQW